jgi:hypothetical protein
MALIRKYWQLRVDLNSIGLPWLRLTTSDSKSRRGAIISENFSPISNFSRRSDRV